MSDKKLDTGTGGINIDGKVYTYDVGVERKVADDGDWNAGDINVDAAKRDLSKGTKLTLGQYMSDTTMGKTQSNPEQARGAGNRYVVNLPVTEESHTLDDGTPRGPDYYKYKDSSFEPTLGPGGSSDEENTDARKTLPRSKWFSEKRVSRGMLRRQGENRIDGNDLLKFDLKVSDNNKLSIDPQHPVAQYSSALVKNRWTSDSQFGSDQTVDNTSRPFIAKKYESGRSYTPEEYTSSNQIVTQRKLAAVGNVLMARASRELNSSEDDLDPASAGFSADALTLPGTAQLAIERVNELELTARDVLSQLAAESVGTVDDNYVNITQADQGLQSFGALNNPYDQFTGISAFGMQLLATAFVAAITLIPSIISVVSNTGAVKQLPTDIYGRLPLGAYARKGKSLGSLSVASIITKVSTGQVDWTELLGFSPTTYPLSDCLTTGILAFYGMYTLDVQRGAFPNAATSQSVANPEAHLVFSRSIFRSFLQISDKLKEVAIGTPLEIAQKVVGLISFFRESRLMRILNVFAQLGNTVLRDFADNVDVVSIGDGLRKSEMDNSHPSGRAAKDKSRLISPSSPGDERSLRHAWSLFRSPDLLIMPRGLTVASAFGKNLGAPSLLPTVDTNEFVGIRNGKSLLGGVYNTVEPETDRITKDARMFIEQQLDAEYVPFYFHDVRTNEIVSFHAFLTSLGDSYSVQYDSSEAFGRVEPVKTYKGTTRKIDVSFQVAALSPEDFDTMWIKINKLTTLAYPQFTEGKQVTSKSFKVTVPFSQQYAAAPMTRIRIGDFIHSNYSRFNLARLFGYTYDKKFVTGTDGKKAEAEDFTNVVKVAREENSRLKKKLDEAKRTSGNKFRIVGRSFFPDKPDLTKELLAHTRPKPPQVIFEVTKGSVKESGADVEYIEGKWVVGTEDDDWDFTEEGSLAANEYIIQTKQLHNLKDDVTVRLRPEALKPVSELQDELELEAADETGAAIDKTQAYQAAFEDFMNPANNSIVRSFESAGGRGIAGFIESLSFDWYSATLWDTAPGRRAPQMCKVTISFSPFHDITPGLDHKGANRAPIYPVGPLKPSVTY